MSCEGWTQLKLADICSKITKGTTPTSIGCKFEGCGINYIKSESISADRKLDTSKFAFISEETQGKLLRSQLQKNDILFSMAGVYLGKTAIVEERDIPANTNQAVAIIRTIKNLAYHEYIYYYLNQHAIVSYINNSSSQSAQPNINLKQIGDLMVTLPPLAEQKAIAAVLSALDDKIELNNKINKTLEEMAQAIFKSWFVDFEPFQDGEFADSELGMIPKGWRVGKLDEIVAVKYGKDHKKLSDGTVPVYGSGGIMRYAERAIYEKESVLIPRKGTLGNVIYINEPFWSVDTMFYTEMKINYVAKYVFLDISSRDLVSMNAGSAVPSMTTDILNGLKIIVPDSEVLEKFEQVVSPLFNSIQSNTKENEKLAQLRDTLLPKLMSGEIRVPLEE